MNGNELLYCIALSKVPGIGNVLARQLVSYFGSAEEVFKRPKGKLLRAPGIGEKTANALIQAPKLELAAAEIERAKSCNIQILTQHHPEFPTRLKHTQDAPFLLYKKGNTDLNAPKVIAIVGTRKASTYGIKITEQLIEDLSVRNDLLVVSGLAYGIDITAHKACIKNNIKTIGVLANGLATVYPDAHANIAKEMMTEGGALLSEYSIDTKAEAPHFPERNRIIAGLSDAVIVVEAAEKGGALITAELANSYDREVFSFPGDVNRTHSKGCHDLIKNYKAHLISEASDLIKMMNWDLSVVKKNTPLSLPETASEEEKLTYGILGESSSHIDELSIKTGLGLGKLSSILLSLELEGFVSSLPGKRFKKN